MPDDSAPIPPEALQANAPRSWGIITAFATAADEGADPGGSIETLMSDMQDSDVGPVLFTLAVEAGLLVSVAANQVIEATRNAYRTLLRADGVDDAAFDAFWRRVIEPDLDFAEIRRVILQAVGSQIPTMDWGGFAPDGKD